MTSTPLQGRAKLGGLLAIVAVAAIAWTTVYAVRFTGLVYQDAADYAQMARQLQRGEGFSSLQSFPYVLEWTRAAGHDGPPWPNVTRFPAITLLEALAFQLVGVGDFGAVLPGGACFVAAAALAFLLGNRVGGSLVGLVVGFMMATSRTQIAYALSGLTEPIAGAVVTAAALAALIAGERREAFVRDSFGLGLIVGVAFLVRYNLLLLAPASALAVWGTDPRSRKACAALIVGMLLPILPWAMHFLFEFGSPVVSLTGTRNLLFELLDGDLFDRFEQVDSLAVLSAGRDMVFIKFLHLLVLDRWREFFGPELVWLLPFFGLSFFALPNVGTRRTAYFAAIALLPTLVAYYLTYTEPRFYSPFAGTLLVVVIATARSMLQQLPERFAAAVPTVALIACASVAIPSLLLVAGHSPQPLRGSEPAVAVSKLVSDDAVIASSLSWLTAWYGDHPSVRFKGDPEILARIDEHYERVGAVWLDAKRVEDFRSALSKSPLADAYREVRRFDDGSVVWLREPRQ